MSRTKHRLKAVSASADTTAKKQPRGRPFKQGQSGNPKGRPRGHAIAWAADCRKGSGQVAPDCLASSIWLNKLAGPLPRTEFREDFRISFDARNRRRKGDVRRLDGRGITAHGSI